MLSASREGSIANHYDIPDAFELAAPVVDEETGAESPESPPTLILDHEETYSLYQCLHTLFHPPVTGE